MFRRPRNVLGVAALALLTLAWSPASALAVDPPLIQKSFAQDAIPVNGTTVLTFRLTNPSSNATTENGVAFFDVFPAGLIVASVPGATNLCGGTFTATASASSVMFVGGTIPVGGSCTVSVDVTGTTRGLKNNTSGPVSSTNGGTGGTASASLAVGLPSLAESFAAPSIALSGSTTLSFTVTNTDASTTGIAFSDSLPDGLALTTPSGLAGSCGGGTIAAADGSTLVNLSGAALGPFASCSFSVGVTGTTPGIKTNTTGPLSSNEGGSGRTASASLTVNSAPASAPVPTIPGKKCRKHRRLRHGKCVKRHRKKH